MIGIYKILNLLDGKCYIGQSINIENRWYEHRKGSCNAHLANAFIKYGLENFEFIVLEEIEGCVEELQHKLDELECRYISEVPLELLYNFKVGGAGNGGKFIAGLAEPVKDKMRLARIAYYDRIGRKPELPPSRYTMTEAHKQKLSEAHKGMIRSAETRQKISAKRKEFSLEKLEYIAECARHACSKKVRCIETGEVFESITRAMEATGCKDISNVLTGRAKTSGGLTWEYVTSPDV